MTAGNWRDNKSTSEKYKCKGYRTIIILYIFISGSFEIYPNVWCNKGTHTADDGMINESPDTSKSKTQTADTARRIPLDSPIVTGSGTLLSQPNPIAERSTNPSVQVNSNEKPWQNQSWNKYLIAFFW